ncbi:MAG: VWA domain-containing protein [Holophagales bacterium]|nr:VWA domain-containing protein [Holophagales bacterium]
MNPATLGLAQPSLGDSLARVEVDGFAHPELAWLLLLLLPVAIARLWGLRRRGLPHAPLQYGNQLGSRSWVARMALPVEMLVVTCAVVTLLGPFREQQLELVDDPGIDVMLVLDVSLSMLAEDFPPNRLEALRRIAHDFVSRSGGHRLGIVAFAGDPYLQSPLSTQLQAVRQLLDDTTVYLLDQAKSGGTAIGDALLVAVERLTAVRLEGRDQAIVLISDGESNLGIDPVLAAHHARDRGIRLYAIGIGGETPIEVRFEGQPVGTAGRYLSSLDDRQLRAVAEAAGGRFDRATDVQVLERLFAELARLESAPLEVRRVKERHSLAWMPSLATFLLFGLHLWLQGHVLRRPFR